MTRASLPRIGVVATSSAIGQIELQMGVEKLRTAGFSVRIHPVTARRHKFWAGTDSQRVEALLEYAHDPAIDVIWCARGGYGVTRILRELDDRTRKNRPPRKKLLVGYSDVTALHVFAARRWGWSTLHAPMPAGESFVGLKDRTEWGPLLNLVSGRGLKSMPWGSKKLRFLDSAPRPRQNIFGPLMGGNLSLWAALAGTPDFPRAAGAILFFEDVSEGLYRIDRYLTQLENAGAFEGVRGIILGDFADCRDTVQKVLMDRGGKYKPLRPALAQTSFLKMAFGELGTRHGFPVAIGLPVGHGPHYSPLPLHAKYRLKVDGNLQLMDWTWGS